MIKALLCSVRESILSTQEHCVMLKEVHCHAHRANASQVRRKQPTTSLLERNFNIILDVANDKQSHYGGDNIENSNFADALRTGILSNFALNYYSSPAEYQFATTNTIEIFRDYANYYAEQIINETKKVGSVLSKQLCGHSGVEEIIAKGKIDPQVIDCLPTGRRMGNVYSSDNINLEILPDGFIKALKRINWSEQFQEYLMRMHQLASPSSKIWSTIIANPRDVERKLNSQSRKRHNTSDQTGDLPLSASFCHADEHLAIEFMHTLDSGVDDFFVEFKQKRSGSENADLKPCTLFSWLAKPKNLSIAAKLNIFCILCGITGGQLNDAITSSTAFIISTLNVSVPKEVHFYASKLKISHNDAVARFRRLAIDHMHIANAKSRNGEADAAIFHSFAAMNYIGDYGEFFIMLAYTYSRMRLRYCALRCYDLGIERIPDDYEAIANRGIVKYKLGDNRGALSDFRFANRKSPKIWCNNPYLYLVHRHDVKRKFDDGMRDKLLRLIRTTEDFSTAQWQSRVDDYHKPKMHYSNLCTAFAMARGQKFRLKCASDMSDQAEGSVFRPRVRERCKQLGMQAILIEQLLNYIGSSSGNVYLGSFDCSGCFDSGRDYMWEKYGRHRGLASAGCALIFRSDIFSKSSGYGWSQLMEDECEYDVPITPEECCLYRVTYDTELQRHAVNEIVDVLIEIVKDKQSVLVKDIVRAILDRVRFLFKHESFAREDEARLLIWRHDKPRVGGVVQEDAQWTKYIECPQSILPSAVLLGKAVSSPDTVADELNAHKLFRHNRVIVRPIEETKE